MIVLPDSWLFIVINQRTAEAAGGGEQRLPLLLPRLAARPHLVGPDDDAARIRRPRSGGAPRDRGPSTRTIVSNGRSTAGVRPRGSGELVRSRTTRRTTACPTRTSRRRRRPPRRPASVLPPRITGIVRRALGDLHAGDREVAARVIDLAAGPGRAQDVDRLVEAARPLVERHVEGGELLGSQPTPTPEREPPAGDLLHGARRAGDGQRVAQRQDVDAGGEAEARRSPRRRRRG